MDNFLNKLDKEIDTFDQRFSAIQKALNSLSERTITSGLPENPVVPDGKDLPGDSLFDNIIGRTLYGTIFSFDSGSADETSFSIIVDNTSDPVILLNRHGEVIHFNPPFAEISGFSLHELEQQDILNWIPETYHPVLRQQFSQALHSGEEHRLPEDSIAVVRTRSKRGEFISLECLFTVYLRNQQPEVAVILRGIARSQEIVTQLTESKEEFETLSESITEALLRISEDFSIIFANSAVHTTFGYTREELLTMSLRDLFPPEIFSRHEEEFRKYFYIDDKDRSTLGMKRTLELLGRHKSRGILPMEMSFGNSASFQGRTLTCIIRDISRRKDTERRLRTLAYYDQLTGLGNRDLFVREIKELLKKCSSEKDRCASLFFLDLDGFKQVNDTLGHEAGDELLIAVSHRLRGSLRNSDSIYRFGGDEFVLLMDTVPDQQATSRIASKLLDNLSTPFQLKTPNASSKEDSTTIRVGASIGIAMIPDDGNDLNKLTKRADLAMYTAKETGKNRYRFFEEGMDTKAVERLHLEQGMRDALGSGGFHLCFQPIVDREGNICGAEALVRWDSPEYGSVSPEVFIPIAEETGMIIPLGNWIIEQSCRRLKVLQDSHIDDFSISINLSMNQFIDKNTCRVLQAGIYRYQLNPENLLIELTETNIMKDPENTIRQIHQLKNDNPGLRFAIDDFGTGYSSLNFLSRLPLDTIKIDRSFIIDIQEEQNLKVVSAIINLAENLDLTYIAEGVETEEQYQLLHEWGCPYMQGYYLHRPMDFDDLHDLLNRI